MGRERAVEVDASCLAPRPQRRGPHDDARGAEAALRAAGRAQAVDERVAHRGIEALDRGDRSARDPRDRRDARDPRLAVDEHRAAPALSLRRAPVLRRDDPEPLAQHREQRLAGRDLDVDGSPLHMNAAR